MNTLRLVLLGGGHAHIQVLKSLGMNPLKNTEVILVSDQLLAPYSGMLPGRLASWFTDDEIHFDLPLACAVNGVQFIHGEVIGLDLQTREVKIKGRAPLGFDLLSVNVGIKPLRKINIVNASHVVSLKPIGALLKDWQGEAASRAERWAVIGGGAAGFEVANVLALNSQRKITWLEKGSVILKSHSPSAQKKAMAVAQRLGIEIRTHFEIEKIDGAKISAKDGSELSFDRIVLATPAEAPEWLAQTGLATSEAGFLRVNDYLQSESDPNIFAAGDCIDFISQRLAKAGVYSVRQGPILIHNLREASSAGQPTLQKYRPQKRFLSLMVSGDHRALLSYGPFTAEGKWVWNLKESIDQNFMEKFQPKMMGVGQAMKMDVNSCGGCGAKVSRAVLSQVLPQIGVDSKFEDTAELPGDESRVTTIDGFRSFTNDQYFFARVAMWHALNDLFASGASPEQVNVFVSLSAGSAPSLQAKQLKEMMLGVQSVLAECGATLGNAHTAESQETSLVINAIGKTISAPWPKGGARLKDRLILTKKLGSGAALQAMMQGKLAAKSWLELTQHLLRSHLKVNEALRGITVHACTDISGFGLLGHLSEMLEGNGLRLNLDRSVVPILSGFKESVAMGVSAFLTQENRVAYAKYLASEGEVAEPIWSLLFDPQTHGPLALSVPAEESSAALSALKKAGFMDAVVVGEFLAKEAAPKPIVLV